MRRSTVVLGASLSLAAAVVASAAAAPAPGLARLSGPVVVDGRGLQVRGLVERPYPSPRLVGAPRLRDWVAYGGLDVDALGRVVLIGRYGWMFAGPDVRHLTLVGFGHP